MTNMTWELVKKMAEAGLVRAHKEREGFWIIESPLKEGEGTTSLMVFLNDEETEIEECRTFKYEH